MEEQVQERSLPGAVCALAVPLRHALLGGDAKPVRPQKLCQAVAHSVVAAVTGRTDFTSVAVVPFCIQGCFAVAALPVLTTACVLQAVSSWPQCLS